MAKGKKDNKEEKEELKNEAAERDQDTQVEEPDVEKEKAADAEDHQEKADTKSENSELDKLKKEKDDLQDKYLRLYSEFENYRRRTSKEKLEIVQQANKDLIQELLPVIDDFERSEKAIADTPDSTEEIPEGIKLVFNKLYKTLENKGLKPIELDENRTFDVELHEAITKIPAPNEDLKGKVVDIVEKGYYLNDKVIRFAKVVIGAE